ncbi:hypothetical protein ACFL6S_31130 [Candidatus Poribacteria bacterium]
MNQVVFLLWSIAHLCFVYVISDKWQDECKALVAKLTELVPDFEGATKGDLKSFGFCAMLMAFVLGLFVIVFG